MDRLKKCMGAIDEVLSFYTTKEGSHCYTQGFIFDDCAILAGCGAQELKAHHSRLAQFLCRAMVMSAKYDSNKKADYEAAYGWCTTQPCFADDDFIPPDIQSFLRQEGVTLLKDKDRSNSTGGAIAKVVEPQAVLQEAA